MLTREAIVQIHPSRFCNLQCLHCYSSSGPKLRPSLAARDILRTTGALAQKGYRRAALSGGEPALYPEFDRLLHGLTDQGYLVSAISNGSRLAELLEPLAAGTLHHAAISFDGLAELHDHIRQKPGAFQTALGTLRALAEAGHGPGVVISVTRHSMPQLPDLVACLVAAGAEHIQLHPLATIGRAAEQTHALGPELPSEAMLRLIMLTEVFRTRHPNVDVRCDAVAGARLRERTAELGALISPLVLADDGALLPYSYDMPRQLALGRVGSTDCQVHIDETLRDLLSDTVRDLTTTPATSFYRHLVKSAGAAMVV